MTKLKIDLRNGILEVEGEETFVREVYQDYKKEEITHAGFKPIDELEPEREPMQTSPKQHHTRNRIAKTGNKRKESYQIVKDLILSTKDGKQSLKDFYSTKSPSNAMERSTVFVYYLQKIADIKNIGVNHIYTCYKDVNEKVPGALRQSLLDTSSRKGWIDTKSMENITISTHGENLVEYEIPSKNEKGKVE
jgi:hypothetical protein